MNLLVAGRRGGKTHMLLREFQRRLAQGDTPWFISFNEPERRRILKLLREEHELPAEVEQRFITIDAAVHRHGLVERNPGDAVLVDNLDIALAYLLRGSVTVATGTDITVERLGPNVYLHP